MPKARNGKTFNKTSQEIMRILAEAYPDKLTTAECFDRAQKPIERSVLTQTLNNLVRTDLYAKDKDPQTGKITFGFSAKGFAAYQGTPYDGPEAPKAKPGPKPKRQQPDQEPAPMANVSPEAMRLADDLSVLVAQNAQYRQALLNMRNTIDSLLGLNQNNKQ